MNTNAERFRVDTPMSCDPTEDNAILVHTPGPSGDEHDTLHPLHETQARHIYEPMRRLHPLFSATRAVVRANRPCLVLLAEPAPGSLRVAMSNPENEASTVTITVDGQLDGEGCSRQPAAGATAISFELPGGMYAGRSVVREFLTANP